MDITVRLREGRRVDAEVDGYTIVTDQPMSNGGQGVAPDPFTLFLASIGTCAGFYVGAYCRTRELPTNGVSLRQHVDKDATGHVTRVALQLVLPPGFPVGHRDGVLRAAAACKVKKALATPPSIEITLSDST